MQTVQPIWNEKENHRFHLRESLVPPRPSGSKQLKALWNSRQNACFITPKLDPEIELHTTVREFEDHYLILNA